MRPITKIFTLSTLFLGLLFTAILFTSCNRKCNKPYKAQQFELGIDLQSRFENDLVKVEIDKQIILNEKISTNFTIDLAASRRITLQGGTHTLKIWINDQLKTAETIEMDQDQYMAINYDRVADIVTLGFSDTPYFYD